MEETKSPLKSTGVIGSVIAIIAVLVNQFLGLQIDEALQTEITEAVTSVAALGGALLALWGRIKATKKIEV